MKIVLYQPQQTNKRVDGQSSLDMIPLEMIHIAPLPLRAGHEIVLIDGSLYDQEEAHRRVVEACEGASIFASTGILGFMISDAYSAAEKVRQRHPGVRRFVGGWFASVMPEVFLREGVFEAAAQGQGELTFDDLVNAVASGSDLEDVPGLALWRDGALHKTAHRPVVGFDQLPDPAWELIDFEPYREGQLRADSPGHSIRMPGPPNIGRRRPYVGFTMFSSFGCPEPCTFCCSPFVTNRRWKAIPAAKMLDTIEMLQERWGKLDVLRFHDANFGVAEKRTKEFAEGLLERGIDIHWNAFIETYSVNNYKPAVLDAMAESGYYIAEVGAETGDPETMKRVGKPIKNDDNYEAAVKLHERNIWASITYIIGFPYEPADSMLATIDEARRIQLDCPKHSTHVLPFRPIPGTKMFEQAVELGYVPPQDIHAWGNIGQYHLQQTWNIIPKHVLRTRELHNHYTTLYKGIDSERRGIFERLAAWRLRKDILSFPLDAKLYYLRTKLFGHRLPSTNYFDQAVS